MSFRERLGRAMRGGFSSGGKFKGLIELLTMVLLVLLFVIMLWP
jgi:hypothetical protein